MTAQIRSLALGDLDPGEIPVEHREFRLAAREAARTGSVTQVYDDGIVIAEIVPVRAASERSEDPGHRVAHEQERHDLLAQAARQHLDDVRTGARRYESMIDSIEHVYELRFTRATPDGPATATEGTPT